MVDETAKPKDEAGAFVLRCSDLLNVRLKRFDAQAYSNIDDLPDEVEFKPKFGFTRPVAVREHDRLFVRTTFAYSMNGQLPTGEHIRIATCKAATEVMYLLHPNSPEFTPEQLDSFALRYGPFHAWGYWREFLHSSMGRLDLPATTLPLFWLHKEERFIIDKPQKKQVKAPAEQNS